MSGSMSKRWFSRAQSTAEYAVVLAAVAAALIGMQIYIKRSVQGRIRDLADQISPAHYEENKTTSTFYTTQVGTTISGYDATKTSTVVSETISRSGSEDVQQDIK